MGQTIKLGLTHGWEVKLARTVVHVKDRTLKNGKVKEGGVEEHFWVGGAKPDFENPETVFLANKFYMSADMRECDFNDLKKHIVLG